MRTYTFQLVIGEIVKYNADSLEEALEMKIKDYGKIPWTVIFNKQEDKKSDKNEEK